MMEKPHTVKFFLVKGWLMTVTELLNCYVSESQIRKENRAGVRETD